MFPVFEELSRIPPLDTALGLRLGFGRIPGPRPRPGSSLCVATDGRPSGDALKAAVSAGLLGQGCKVVDLGIVPNTHRWVANQAFKASGRFRSPRATTPLPTTDSNLSPRGPRDPRRTRKGFGRAVSSQPPSIEAVERCGRLGTPRDFGFPDPSSSMSTRPWASLTPNRSEKRRFRVLLDANGGVGGPAMTALLDRLNVDLVRIGAHPMGTLPMNPTDLGKSQMLVLKPSKTKRSTWLWWLTRIVIAWP